MEIAEKINPTNSDAFKTAKEFLITAMYNSLKRTVSMVNAK